MKLLSAAAAAATIVHTSAAMELLDTNQTAVSRPSHVGSSLNRLCGGSAQQVDLPGSDIGSVKQADWRNCIRECDNSTYCRAWTWTDYNGGTCWLKSGFGQAVYRAGAMSGVVYPPVNGQCNTQYLILANCDMTQYDVGSVRGNSYQDCIAPAVSKSPPVFFTWSDYNGGTCWLKYQVSPCQNAPNKYTGIFLF